MKDFDNDYLSYMVNAYTDLGLKLIPLGSYDKWRVLDNGKVIPLGKSPCVEDWRNTKFSRSYMLNHVNKGKNVGFLLGDKDLVIDVDPRNGGLDGLKLLEKDLGFRLGDIAPCIITGSGGFHYYFKKPDTFRAREYVDEYGKGVEFKTVGRQVVIPGSLHPGESKEADAKYRGQQYVWDDLGVELSEIPESPNRLLTLIERKTSNNESQSGLMSCDTVAEILSSIPVTEFNDNSKWFELMTAVHFATDGQAIDEFIEWSTADPDYANDDSLIRYRWNSLDTSKEVSTTHRTLLFHAEKYGVDISAYEAKLDFDELIDEDDDGTIVLDSEAAASQLQSLLNSVDPVEIAMSLTPDYSSEDLEEALLACLRADTITRMKCLKIIQRVTGLTKADIKTIMKDVEDRQIRDLAEILTGYVLDKKFNKGRHLIFNIDGRFWCFNDAETHWQPMREEWLAGKVVAVWQKIRDKIGISATTTTLVNQSMMLLKMTRAVNDDVFGFAKPPKPVINTLNHEIWLRPDGSYKLKPHSYKSYLTHCLDVEFDELAECPLWDKSIRQIFEMTGNPENMVRHFEEFMGYMIQPNKNIASWWMLKGFGSNGKSMLMDVVSYLIGETSVISKSIHDFNTARNNHALASLPGKLMILDDDLDTHTILPDGILKKISEQKLLDCNPKGKDEFSFISCATPVLLTNYFPKARDVSNGTRRRVHVIPFDRQFETVEIDRTLKNRIKENDIPGILNRALEGLRRLRVRGYFDEPAECLNAKQTWLDEANTVPAFIRECCDISHIEGTYVTLKDLYMAYEQWHREQGVSAKALGKRNFAENLAALGYKVFEAAGHQRRIAQLKVKRSLVADDFDNDFDEDDLE